MIVKMIFNYINSYDLPHSAVIHCFVSYFEMFFESAESIQMESFNKSLATFFRSSGAAGFGIHGGEYGEDYSVSNIWSGEDLDLEGEPVNHEKEFHDDNKFVAVVQSRNWFYWDDSCPYLFPIVAYSRKEIEAWFMLFLYRAFQTRSINNRHEVLESVECFIDAGETTFLMKQKLSCKMPWEFGPARINEPNFNLWHEKTRDQNINAWLAKWLNHI
jgi:hypothetical protein